MPFWSPQILCPLVARLCAAFWLAQPQNLWSAYGTFSGLAAARNLDVFRHSPFPLSFLWSLPLPPAPRPYFPPQGAPSFSLHPQSLPRTHLQWSQLSALEKKKKKKFCPSAPFKENDQPKKFRKKKFIIFNGILLPAGARRDQSSQEI